MNILVGLPVFAHVPDNRVHALFFPKCLTFAFFTVVRPSGLSGPLQCLHPVAITSEYVFPGSSERASMCSPWYGIRCMFKVR